MRIFNRIVVILLLAALFALGVFVFLASISPFLNTSGAQGTDLQNLPPSLRPDGLRGAKRLPHEYRERQRGRCGRGRTDRRCDFGADIARPRTQAPDPRRVRMQQGTYITRSAVRDEATRATEHAAPVEREGQSSEETGGEGRRHGQRTRGRRYPGLQSRSGIGYSSTWVRWASRSATSR